MTKNVDMRKLTTYKLKGIVKEVLHPKDILELIELLKELKDKKYMVLGNGSNVVFLNDYDGTVIKLDNFNMLSIEDNIVTVGAGYSIIKLALETAKLGLSGLEFASGIPGTVGGCIYGNAGAYNKDIASIIKEVTILDDSLKIRTLNPKQMSFAYRKSILQNNNYICLSAVFELKHKDKKEILDLIKNRRKRRQETQPLNKPSAGSVFRNPDGDHAGRIIESLGYKGKSIGGAMVSEKHANFIINHKNASGKDILALVNMVKKEVKDKYNIDLITEQEFID